MLVGTGVKCTSLVDVPAPRHGLRWRVRKRLKPWSGGISPIGKLEDRCVRKPRRLSNEELAPWVWSSPVGRRAEGGEQ